MVIERHSFRLCLSFFILLIQHFSFTAIAKTIKIDFILYTRKQQRAEHENHKSDQ